MTVIGEALREALEKAARDDYRRLHGAEIAKNINGPLIDVERAAAVAESTILRAPRRPWILVLSGKPPEPDRRAEFVRRAGQAGALVVMWLEGDSSPRMLDDGDLAREGLIRLELVEALAGLPPDDAGGPAVVDAADAIREAVKSRDTRDEEAGGPG